ncbi:MAG: hypothetical protein ACYCTB_06525 [bacterium]
MPYEEELEVTSVNPAFDVHTGKNLYQISFGTYGKFIKGLHGQMPGSETASNKVIIYIPKEKECQYKVGSKWLIKVTDIGTVSIVKAK